MRLFPSLAPKTDEEVVADVRIIVARDDRWRSWLVGFNIVLAIVVLGILVFAVVLLSKFRLNPNGFPGMELLGLACGVALGMFVGSGLAHVVNGLLFTLFGLRRERMMLRYHDELVALREELENDVDADGDDL